MVNDWLLGYSRSLILLKPRKIVLLLFQINNKAVSSLFTRLSHTHLLFVMYPLPASRFSHLCWLNYLYLRTSDFRKIELRK